MHVTRALVLLGCALWFTGLSACDGFLNPVEGEGEVGGGEGEGTLGEGEGEGFAGEGEGEGAAACSLTDAGDPDKTRIVLVGHAFTDDPNTPGTEIRSLTLVGDSLIDNTTLPRLDVHTAPARIAFVPSGDLAIVLGADGHLASVKVTTTSMTLADELNLPSGAEYRDLRISADGRRAYITGFNTTEADGVRVVAIACDGTLLEDTAAFFGIRLAASLAFLSPTRALLLGGQAVFDPVDANDVRLLGIGAPATSQVAAFDIFSDGVDATRIGASPDGTLAAVPNDALTSTESGDISLLSIAGDVVTEADRATGFADAAEALFSPDGNTLLVSQVEPNQVAVFDVSARTLVPTTPITGIGLAEQMDIISRGTESGLVLVAATNDDGNVHLLLITGPGLVSDLGSVDLGAGAVNIPTPIAVQP